MVADGIVMVVLVLGVSMRKGDEPLLLWRITYEGDGLGDGL